MTKQSGLGDQFYVGSYDLSGAVNALTKIASPVATLDFTTISQSASARGYGLRDGEISFTSLMKTLAGVQDPPLSSLPRTDTIGTYIRGPGIGNAAACILAKQVNYDPSRDNAGNLLLTTQLLANGDGLEWGEQLTAGLRTDSAATIGPFIDDGAASSFGGQAYFQLTGFTGTSVVVDIQHSTTSGGTYTTTGLTWTAGTPRFQRVQVANTTTINRYLKVVTTGTFSNAVFSVVFVRNPVAGVVF